MQIGREGTELTVFTDNQEARGNVVRQGYVASFLNYFFTSRFVSDCMTVQ